MIAVSTTHTKMIHLRQWHLKILRNSYISNFRKSSLRRVNLKHSPQHNSQTTETRRRLRTSGPTVEVMAGTLVLAQAVVGGTRAKAFFLEASRKIRFCHTKVDSIHCELRGDHF